MRRRRPFGSPPSVLLWYETHPVSDQPLLELRGVSKSFGSVQALTDVDFEVRHGEVMALVGDNGAGKSTLIKCIAGIHPMDEGAMTYDGDPVSINNPKDAARLGSRSSTRISRSATTSTSSRTCILGREVTTASSG